MQAHPCEGDEHIEIPGDASGTLLDIPFISIVPAKGLAKGEWKGRFLAFTMKAIMLIRPITEDAIDKSCVLTTRIIIVVCCTQPDSTGYINVQV